VQYRVEPGRKWLAIKQCVVGRVGVGFLDMFAVEVVGDGKGARGSGFVLLARAPLRSNVVALPRRGGIGRRLGERSSSQEPVWLRSIGFGRLAV